MDQTSNISKTNKENKTNKTSSKTMKKRDSNNNKTKEYYLTKYLNTEELPFTRIFQYINKNYKEYKSFGVKVNQFPFYFQVGPDFIHNNKKININQSIKKNPTMNLNKLLSYALYSKSSDFFQENGTMNIRELKNQIGKDTSRIDILINEKPYQSDHDESKNDKKADFFMVRIIDELNKEVGENIDYNLVNQIGIACCQNIFNLLVDQLTITIMKAIHPETCAFLNGKKHVELTLNKVVSKAFFFFSADIVISYQELLDPEYTCGNLDFKFVMDFNKNTFYFEKFALNYHVDRCNPELEFEEDLELEEQELKQEKKDGKFVFLKKFLKLHKVIGVTSAMLSAPFILGAIGGNKSKIKKKTQKKAIIKKHDYKKTRKNKKNKLNKI
jgi:hypothetical protein